MSDENTHLKTILFVFDDPILPVLFNYTFLKNDFRVQAQEADNLIDAQLRLENDKPDLMIIDYLIDDYKGIEFVRSLRSKPAFETLPIILYIVIGHPTIIDEAHHAGVSAILLYPLNPKDFLGLVQSLLT